MKHMEVMTHMMANVSLMNRQEKVVKKLDVLMAGVVRRLSLIDTGKAMQGRR